MEQNDLNCPSGLTARVMDVIYRRTSLSKLMGIHSPVWMKVLNICPPQYGKLTHQTSNNIIFQFYSSHQLLSIVTILYFSSWSSICVFSQQVELVLVMKISVFWCDELSILKIHYLLKYLSNPHKPDINRLVFSSWIWISTLILVNGFHRLPYLHINFWALYHHFLSKIILFANNFLCKVC